MMNEQDQMTPFEARLASIRPRGPSLDRDRLMFLAGQASVAYAPVYRQSSVRPAVLSAAVAIVVTLLVMTATESGSRIVDHVAAVATTGDLAQAQPARPSDDAVECRVEVGNSLGWVFRLILGSKATDAKSKPFEKTQRDTLEDMLREQPGMPRTEPDQRHQEQADPAEKHNQDLAQAKGEAS